VLPFDFAIDWKRFYVLVDQIDLRSVAARVAGFTPPSRGRSSRSSGWLAGGCRRSGSARRRSSPTSTVTWRWWIFRAGIDSDFPPQHPYTLCVCQSAEESDGDRPTAFQKVGWDADSPGRGGARRSGVRTTRAYQNWALPEAL
jgi:hypothetical protein